MVRQALVPVAAGSLAGLAGAVLVGRAMEGFLFQVSGTDPMTLFGVVGLLAAVAVLASLVPARRASRMDPVQALREE
jgi:ABC-type antimicrobial peptide transport system permease subunit